MATFYIFRHGETFVTKQSKIWYGRQVFSAPILEEGKPAIHRMGQYFKNIPTDANFVSPYKRCRQTVEIITEESGKGFIIDKRLGEFFWEPFGHFKRRVKRFLAEVERHGYGSVAVCSHGAVIAAIVKMLRESNLSPHDEFFYPNPGILYIVTDKEIKVVDFNQ
jgi:broad specificity phosphatase PhoE